MIDKENKYYQTFISRSGNAQTFLNMETISIEHKNSILLVEELISALTALCPNSMVRNMSRESMCCHNINIGKNKHSLAIWISFAYPVYVIFHIKKCKKTPHRGCFEDKIEGIKILVEQLFPGHKHGDFDFLNSKSSIHLSNFYKTSTNSQCVFGEDWGYF